MTNSIARDVRAAKAGASASYRVRPCGRSAPRRQAVMLNENPAISIEALRPQDLPAALRSQAETYPPFLVEEEGVFLNRINLAASFCLAAKREGELVGYLLAHGWSRQSPPPLG